MDSSALWTRVISEGVEDRVEVNQRMLIDKMLSRYSSDFVVFRELIQNSDDAQATSFQLKFHCDSSRRDDVYQPLIKESSSSQPRQQTQTNLLKGFLGQLLPPQWKSSSASSSPPSTTSSREEEEFDHSLIDEIRCVNNGKVFDQSDWKRVQTIAEGNTNVESIGQFGVGFFSVFSYSEKPLIQSGGVCLAFHWKNGQSLTTFRQQVNEEQDKPFTSIILPMKEKFLLETKDLSSSGESETKKRSTKRNVRTNEIVPTLNFHRLKRYLTKVLSFTKCLREVEIFLNDRPIFTLKKRIEPLHSSRTNLILKRLNTQDEHHFFHLDSGEEMEEVFQLNGENNTITFHHLNIQTSVHIDREFHQKIKAILKKDLPPRIQIEYLLRSDLSSASSSSLSKVGEGEILQEINPMKMENGQWIPRGQIFIGLATQQTTGLGIHLFTHLIPTIERENVDLQDPYISIWNEQLLFSAGKILRLLYQQLILQSLYQQQEQQTSIEQRLQHLYTTFAFQRSSPSPQIGSSLSPLPPRHPLFCFV